MKIGNILSKVHKNRDKVYTLYLALKDKRTPKKAKALIMLILLYIASPIDIIPDFIPIIGQLDDLVIITLGVYLCYKLIPEEVLLDCKNKKASDIIT